MTRQPIGPKPLPDDLVRAMKTFAITNSLQGAEGDRPMILTPQDPIEHLEDTIELLDERVAKLEAALQRLVNASEPVEEYTHEVAVELEEAIKTAKSVLKEPDQ